MIHGASAHIALDLGSRSEVWKSIQDLGPAAILHAASSGVTEKVEFSEMLRSNVAGADNLLSAAASLSSPPSVVMAGSGYEYAAQSRPLTEDDPIRPASPYGISKAAAAFCAANYATGMPITVLRIFNVYGPGERLPRLLPYIVRNAKLGNPVKLTACEQVRDFIYVQDLASIFWRALEYSPENGQLRTLNVGSGSPVPVRDFVCTVVRVLREEGVNAQVKFGARPYRANEPMYYAPDTSRLHETLGRPSLTFREVGIRQFVEAM
jgi:nucleoside-diphosphate-sugar epimerase